MSFCEECLNKDAKIAALEELVRRKDEALNDALNYVGVIQHGDTWSARQRIEGALALKPESK